MKNALFVVVGGICLGAVPAIADEAKPPETSPAAAEPPPPAAKPAQTEAPKPYTPRSGLWSLQLDGPAFPMWQGVPGYNNTRGFGVTVPSSGGQTGVSGGVAGSLGYTLSDLIELGAAVGFVAARPPLTGDSVLGINVEPFLKFARRRDLREKAFRAWIARGEGG